MKNLIFNFQKLPDKNTAWVFSGQGSQKVGMGLDLQKIPMAKKRFQQVEKLLGWSILECCQIESKLSRTYYVQLSLYTILSIVIDLMREQGHNPNLVAGYSLGEYMALYAAKVFDFETGLDLIKYRAQLMESSTEGIMAILIGFNQEQLEEEIQQTANVWRINDDLTSAVISGTPEAVESVLTKVKTEHIVRLKPNKAFHTPLIAKTVIKFQEFLESIPFESAKIPVLSSVELTPAFEAAQLKRNLIKQMTEPVYWRKLSLKLAAEGIEKVVELGPSKGLIRQMKRICPNLIYSNVSNPSPFYCNISSSLYSNISSPKQIFSNISSPKQIPTLEVAALPS